MNFIKSWQFSVGVAVAIAVLAISGVIYGVVSHTEPGWMPEGPLWTSPVELGPIRICVRTYSAPYVLPEDVTSASFVVSRINTRVGFSLYSIDADPESLCPVTLTYGVPTQEGWQEPGGAATLNRNALICDVEVSNVTGEFRSLVVYHELGHCLGLDHDDFNSSIMRRSQRSTVSGQIPPMFSDFDTNLIRNHYGPLLRVNRED